MYAWQFKKICYLLINKCVADNHKRCFGTTSFNICIVFCMIIEHLLSHQLHYAVILHLYLHYSFWMGWHLISFVHMSQVLWHVSYASDLSTVLDCARSKLYCGATHSVINCWHGATNSRAYYASFIAFRWLSTVIQKHMCSLFSLLYYLVNLNKVYLFLTDNCCC